MSKQPSFHASPPPSHSWFSAPMYWRSLLAALERHTGAVGLESLLTEITKLNAVRKLGLPAELFAGCSETMLTA
ncbi:hypothetical protein ACGH2B_06530 [Streptomyces sp. BBFR2]|uniref:hypothetical protein n=1 Tax=Streptomyces sp. BBFR2 TaxID=3372854 RepID=UPI0037DA6F4A